MTLQSHREGCENYYDQFTIHRPTFRWLHNASDLSPVSLDSTVKLSVICCLARINDWYSLRLHI